ncbi:MAG: hypothetical protein ACRCTE_12080 [Cellulosilyticaceae bacterium]
MNMNKLKNFTKKYGFYLAVGFISVGAITAVIITSNQEGNIGSQANPYAPNEETIGRVIDEVEMPDDQITDDVENSADVDEVATNDEQIADTQETSETPAPEAAQPASDDAIAAETFNSTTLDNQEAPFFAEGDTLLLPVDGKVVVPYTDDTTKHWYSDALEQTMRTYGVAVSAKDGESIKAPATAKVLEVVDNSAAVDSIKYVGNVGQIIVMDLGNNYTCKIGVEGGKVSEDLVGQVVLAGQEIGVAGSGTGPFAGTDGSVYIQLEHKGETLDPTDMFAFNE